MTRSAVMPGSHLTVPRVALQVLGDLARGVQPTYGIPRATLKLMRGRGWVTGTVVHGLEITEAGRSVASKEAA